MLFTFGVVPSFSRKLLSLDLTLTIHKIILASSLSSLITYSSLTGQLSFHTLQRLGTTLSDLMDRMKETIAGVEWFCRNNCYL